ncbi:hypothetical protein [Reinekea sp.]|jgi:hypothetical protein|uniref:GNAT family N-acetyltransferase n=1 Tax=Reinekea sp. TaxID=1970455 RepID=UPI002A83E7A3|nr:hypothetical protein [Reinekea sp.]
MTPLNKLNYLFGTFRNYGFKECLRIGWMGVFYRGASRLVLVALTKPRCIERTAAASKFYDFHFASVAELEVLSKIPDYEITQLDIDRVRNGISRCLVQLDGSELTGYTWVWLNKLAYITDGFYLNLPDDAIYNYKALTLPAYRGYGFQGLRHLKLLEFLRPEGITRLFGFVDSYNTKSFRGVKKSGFEPVGELVIMKGASAIRTQLRLRADFWPGSPVEDDTGRAVN